MIMERKIMAENLRDNAHPASPELLTIQQAAELLNVSVGTVRKWITSGELNAYRYGAHGRIVRITRDDIHQFATPIIGGAK